jgi:hypothetical protein
VGNLTVKYLASSKDGKLWLSINSQVYCYHLDAAHIPWVKRMLGNCGQQPGRVLNFVKRQAFHYTKEASIIDVS